MDSLYPPYPGQDYIITPNSSSQGTASNSNIKPPTPICLDQFNLHRKYPKSVNEDTTDTYQWNSCYNAHTTSASTEVQGALKEYDYRSGSGFDLNDQPWPALNNYNIDFDSLHHVASPVNAHAISDPVSMTQWTPTNYLTAQLSSTHCAPVVSQPIPIMMEGIPLPAITVHPAASHLPRLCCSGNAAYVEQEQKEVQNARTAMPKVNDAVAQIGSILSNGKFVCDVKGCGSQTFARQAELRRHYTTLHAANKPNFWCQIPTCCRSMIRGGKAFHRKDKLVAHVRSMHPNVQPVYS